MLISDTVMCACIVSINDNIQSVARRKCTVNVDNHSIQIPRLDLANNVSYLGVYKNLPTCIA